MTLLDPVLGAFAAVPAIEWGAAGLALGYLGFAIRQSAWCWAFAVASAVLYLVVFARAGLVMQAALQVFYVGMSVYGWRSWRGSASTAPRAVSRWTMRQHAVAWAAVAALALVNGWVITQGASSWVPYLDAAIAWGSVLTTWMVARKVLENWLYWVVLDSTAALLAAWQGLATTALLFLLYAAFALRGYWQWRRDARLAVAHES
ncbi:MAG: nicotinamide mononucleotide transporter [Proteobacteria bacterium]|nr:nicotinamide mononucleotide transporter [Pseudomonadota bacterium]